MYAGSNMLQMEVLHEVLYLVQWVIVSCRNVTAACNKSFGQLISPKGTFNTYIQLQERRFVTYTAVTAVLSCACVCVQWSMVMAWPHYHKCTALNDWLLKAMKY